MTCELVIVVVEVIVVVISQEYQQENIVRFVSKVSIVEIKREVTGHNSVRVVCLFSQRLL